MLSSLKKKPLTPYVVCSSLLISHNMHYSCKGATIVDSPELSTVLVSDKVYRTKKFLSAIAKGLIIVSEDWVKAIQAKKKLVHPDDYVLNDEFSEKRFRFKLADSLKKARTKPLFAACSIFVTPSTIPPPDELQTIINCGGGKCLREVTSVPRKNDKLLVVSSTKDADICKLLVRKYPGITVINTEGFMMNVVRQTLNFTPYLLNK